MSCGAEEGVELLYTLLGCCEAMRREEGEGERGEMKKETEREREAEREREREREREAERERGRSKRERGGKEIEGERKNVLLKGRKGGIKKRGPILRGKVVSRERL